MQLKGLLHYLIPLAGIIMACMMGSQIGTLFALAIAQKAVLYLIIVQWFFTLPLALYLAYSRDLGVIGFFIAQSIC